VYRYLKPTPLYHYAGLSALVGAEVWIKHENHHPVGAFKVRGGLNLAANLSSAERAAGLFTASTGNHGQSIAFAGRTFGIEATIAVPEGANPGKVAAMRGLGATVIHHGADFDTAREWIMGVAAEKGGRFVLPTEEPLICGVGTYGLEIVEGLPDVETIIVPVGGGSGACGTSIAAKGINPKIEVIGAQSAQAPAMQRSWASGKLVSAETSTFAEGVATRVPFPNTQRIMRHYLDDFLLVDDAAIREAVRLLLQHTHNLAEGAGAIALATALAYKDRFSGKKVVLVMSGGNLSLENLRDILG
ncbi:MAG TPA: threonine/serine dehydratase, partial [Anaerolineae bacterium]|nr:threonine/serine dehydratase [Anaerolineae bacterium]